MRTLLPSLLLLALITACGGDAPAPVEDPSAPIDTAHTVQLVPLTGSGLRFDGVYHAQDGNIQYYLRFFERGNVALVSGPQVAGDSVHIADYLTENVQSGWNSVHNTPVERHNDSLFFQTMAMNGAITYAGVASSDSAVFLKASRINGKRAIVAYRFEPHPLPQ